MYQFSDSDSVDSDEGIRFKTESIRNKQQKHVNRDRNRSSRRTRSRSRSRSRNRDRYRRPRRSSSLDDGRRIKESQKYPRRAEQRDRQRDRKDERRKEGLREKYSSELTQGNRKTNEERSPTIAETEIPLLGRGLSPHLQKIKKNDEEPSSSKSKEVKENSGSFVGPALPPHLQKQNPEVETECGKKEEKMEETDKEEKMEETDKEEESSYIGPALPPHLQQQKEDKTIYIGPALPPHLQKKEEVDEDNEEEDTYIGPALPPNQQQKRTSTIGPALPPHLLIQKELEEDDDDVYGPLPEGETKYKGAHLALEERALQLKLGRLETNKEEVKVREEWMLELPEVKAANLGLGPRQFRSKGVPDMSNRSAWTETPDKNTKKKDETVDLQKVAELKEIAERDKQQEELSKKHKKKHKESLLEMHQNKMKKKKGEEGPSERRPFSREIDLQVNRFDEAQKKAVLKKAQLLDDRFSSGQSKFL